jgi:hypothetical protein
MIVFLTSAISDGCGYGLIGLAKSKLSCRWLDQGSSRACRDTSPLVSSNRGTVTSHLSLQRFAAPAGLTIRTDCLRLKRLPQPISERCVYQTPFRCQRHGSRGAANRWDFLSHATLRLGIHIWGFSAARGGGAKYLDFSDPIARLKSLFPACARARKSRLLPAKICRRCQASSRQEQIG